MKHAIWAVMAAGALVACEDKSTPPPASADAVQVATEEDFEEEAEKDITATNLAAEVDKLAAEIDAP